MATTTGTCTVFDAVKNWLGDNSVDLSSNTFGIMLLDDTLNAGAGPDRSTAQFVSDIVSAEVSGGGYARKTFSGSWTASGGANGQMMLDAADQSWSVSGSNLVARYWVLYDETPGTDATRNLLAFGLLDDNDADVTTTPGNTLTLNVNALGFFTVG